MNNDNKHVLSEAEGLVPKYRFPEFKNNDSWEIKELKTIGELVNGLTYSPNDVADRGILVLRSSNIRNNRIVLDDNVYVNKTIHDVNPTKKGDILVCVRNGSKSLIGKNALIKDEMPNTTHGAFMTIFRSKNYFFVNQLFQSDTFFKQVHQDLGATINSINGKNLLNYKFCIPSNPAEQQKIAACLSSLDDVIAGHEERLTALEEHKKGLMQNLFPQEGETKPKFRFPEFENDGEWVEINILEIASMKARIGWQNLRTDEHLNQGEYYLVTGTDFKNNRVDWNNAKFVSYDRYIQDEYIILKEGDILITKDGSIGKVAYVNNINDRKSTLNNGIFRIRINENYKSEFIFHSFLSTRFKLFLDKLSGGSSIVHLYQKDFEKYLIQLPINIEEQQKIASVLSSVDDLIVSQQEKIAALKEHKKGLMQGLFPKIES